MKQTNIKTLYRLTLLSSVAALALVSTACGKEAISNVTPANTAPAAANTAPIELKALLDGKAKVVDVRTPGEFASGHHPRAVNIPIDEVQTRLSEFGDKSKPVVVYCASGNRSGRAKQILESAGYSHVTNAGGFRDLPQ